MSTETKEKNLSSCYTGLGKRKTSVAKIFLKEGSGIFIVNKKSFEDFFSGVANERESVKNPFLLVNLTNQYDVEIQVKGGGLTGQLEAIRLAIAKAICTINKEYRQTLKQALLLRRDSRIKERRKYGLKKARKASQYSKR
jgi:small subunit ribosomal protein S9